MKLILSGFVTTLCFLIISCAGLNTEIQRAPASTGTTATSSLAKLIAKKPAFPTYQKMDTYLRYQLIKGAGFDKIDRQDCKGYAQQNSIQCKSKDCKAIIDEQESQCEDPVCKAILSEREELCPDKICRALISNHIEKCDSVYSLCNSVITQESSACNNNKDCKAYIEKNGIACQTPQCKGIVNENLNFCDEGLPPSP